CPQSHSCVRPREDGPRIESRRFEGRASIMPTRLSRFAARARGRRAAFVLLTMPWAVGAHAACSLIPQRTQLQDKAGPIRSVNLRALRDGRFRMRIVAKGWLTSASANLPAESTTLTVSFGPTCFTRIVTKKD